MSLVDHPKVTGRRPAWERNPEGGSDPDPFGAIMGRVTQPFDSGFSESLTEDRCVDLRICPVDV